MQESVNTCTHACFLALSCCLIFMRVVSCLYRLVLLQAITIFTCITTGSSQCFTSADCMGDQVPAGNQRECCIETNTGLSYNDGGTCTECIGIAIYRESSTVHNVIAFAPPFHSSWVFSGSLHCDGGRDIKHQV